MVVGGWFGVRYLHDGQGRLMIWSNDFPPSFDVGDPNGGHEHFDASGVKFYGPDGVTVLFEYDSATGNLSLTGALTVGSSIPGASVVGAVANATNAANAATVPGAGVTGTVANATNSLNLSGGGVAAGSTTITGSLIVGNPAGAHVVVGSDVHGADGVRLYAADGVTPLIDMSIAATPTITSTTFRTAAIGQRIVIDGVADTLTLFAPDGVTVLSKLDPATGLTVNKGSITGTDIVVGNPAAGHAHMDANGVTFFDTNGVTKGLFYDFSTGNVTMQVGTGGAFAIWSDGTNSNQTTIGMVDVSTFNPVTGAGVNWSISENADGSGDLEANLGNGAQLKAGIGGTSLTDSGGRPYPQMAVGSGVQRVLRSGTTTANTDANGIISGIAHGLSDEFGGSITPSTVIATPRAGLVFCQVTARSSTTMSIRVCNSAGAVANTNFTVDWLAIG
jgi:hypothetical protein